MLLMLAPRTVFVPIFQVSTDYHKSLVSILTNEISIFITSRAVKGSNCSFCEESIKIGAVDSKKKGRNANF